VTEPTETPRRLFRKAARGEDEATPAIVISGVTMLVAAAVAIVAVIAFAIYFLL
jgi:hypothetical protein